MVDKEDYLLNNTEIKIIFGNVLPIYQVHRDMLEELKCLATSWQEDSSIGSVFLKYVIILAHNIGYLNNISLIFIFNNLAVQ